MCVVCLCTIMRKLFGQQPTKFQITFGFVNTNTSISQSHSISSTLTHQIHNHAWRRLTNAGDRPKPAVVNFVLQAK